MIPSQLASQSDVSYTSRISPCPERSVENHRPESLTCRQFLPTLRHSRQKIFQTLSEGHLLAVATVHSLPADLRLVISEVPRVVFGPVED